jgi:hypothetical protein
LQIRLHCVSVWGQFAGSWQSTQINPRKQSSYPLQTASSSSAPSGMQEKLMASVSK